MQLAVQDIICCQHLRIRDMRATPSIVGHKAASFTHEKATSSRIPRSEATFPEPIIAASGEPCEVKACGAEAPDASDGRTDGAKYLGPFVKVAMPFIGRASRDKRFV